MASAKVSSLDFNVDLDEIEALNQKRTLAFINHWVYNTVQFLNQFSRICQSRLLALETKLRRANDALSILESKLASIPGLDDITVPTSDPADNQSTETPKEAKDENTPSTQEEQPPPSVPVEAVTPDAKEPTDEEKNLIPVSSHPLFSSFFKMVSFGVPKEAVKLKMAASGLDPSILDNPSALVENKKEDDQKSASSSSNTD